MGDFLDRYHLLKVTQDQVTDLNSPICHKEIKAIINPPQKNSPGAHSIGEETYTTFKEEQISRLLKIGTERILPDSFYEVTVTLIPDPHKDSTKKETAHVGHNA